MPVPPESASNPQVLKQMEDLKQENAQLKKQIKALTEHEQAHLDQSLENQNLKNQLTSLKEAKS